MKFSAQRIIGILMTGSLLGIGAGWYMVSGKVVRTTQAFITETLNRPHADGSKLTLAYDDIQRAGFPAVGVRLVNPKLTFDSPPSSGALPETHVSWKRQGTLDIVTEMLDHAYRITSNGSAEVSMQVGDTTQSLNSAKNHAELLVKAKTQEGFTAWETMDWSKLENILAALQQLRVLHLATGPLTLTNSNGAVLFSQGNGHLDLANNSTDLLTDIDFSASLKDSVVTKEYNDFILRTLSMMGMPNLMAGTTTPFAAERAGKQDMNIAFSAKLPRQKEAGPMPNGEVHVTKFSVRNNFYTLDLPLDVVLKEEKGRRNANVRVNWSAEVKPASAAESKILIDSMSQLPFLGVASNNAAGFSAEMKEKILAALPTVSTLGPITLAIDLTASTPIPDEDIKGPTVAADGKRETLSLRRFAFDHKRWGLEAKAEAARDDQGAAKIDATILCRQCSTLTGDSLAEASAVDEVLKENDPARASLPITPETQAKLDQTLAEIGQKDAASGNITFTITTPLANDFRLGGQPINEALAKLSAVFAPAPPTH